MDIKQQCITEYLTQGIGYRQLAAKYGVSRTTICKWVQIHQGIHHLSLTQQQQKYYLSAMNRVCIFVFKTAGVFSQTDVVRKKSPKKESASDRKNT